MVSSLLEVPNSNSSEGQQLVYNMTIKDPSTISIEVSNNFGMQFVPDVAIIVKSDLEVPNNNSSGQQRVPDVGVDTPSSIDVSNNSGLQLVPYVATAVTSILEVRNNSSFDGQQLVDHMVIDVPSSIEVPNNNFMLQDGNNNGDWNPAAYFGVANSATTIIAVMNKTPSSSEPVYLAAEVIVFTAGILQVLATIWVSHDARNRRAAERVTLYASIITFVLSLFVNAYALK